MKVINILHISDLHFSNKADKPETADIKDPFVSSPFINAISGKAEDQFLTDIRGFLPGKGFDFIACTGDLGDSGIKNNIKMGAEYLKRLANTLNISAENVFISPGNHDLKRKSKPENGLKDFCDICDDLGFSYANYKSSTLKKIHNIPVLILNTCLGGTEKANFGYSKKDWDNIKNALKKETPILQEDLDIPAIGLDQLSNLKSNICGGHPGDLSIILMHHNPLPTNNTELKPYANIIDSGKFISYCLESQKHIIVLHGHTHCDTELTVTKYDHRGIQPGWITTLGKNKFHHAAAVIELWLTENNDFIKAKITDIEYVTSKYNRNFRSILRSTIVPEPPEWLNKIQKNNFKIKFKDFAQQIDVQPNEDLAIQLLQNEDRSIDINMNGTNDYFAWTIGRLR